MINVLQNKLRYRTDSSSLSQTVAATTSIPLLCFLGQLCSKSALGLREVRVKPKRLGMILWDASLTKKHYSGCSQ